MTEAMAAALRGALAFVLIIAVWEVAASQGSFPPQLLPSPFFVLQALIAEFVLPSFWLDLGISILRVFAGFALSAAVAIPIGLLTVWIPWFRDSYTPFNNYIRYLPVAALLPLLILCRT
jgi:NitT/TauT family transport system permease protein